MLTCRVELFTVSTQFSERTMEKHGKFRKEAESDSCNSSQESEQHP